MADNELDKRPLAFVLMPFGDDFDVTYADLLVPALEKAGYEVRRADTTLDQQSIIKDIVRSIADARLVVADLTAMNGNVLYELGIAHALGVPTVMIAQSLEAIPFDLRSYRVIPYTTRFREALQLMDKLSEIAVGYQTGAVGFGNPVTDFVSREDLVALVSTTKERFLPQTMREEEPGQLDLRVDIEAGMKDILGHLTSFAERAVKFSEVASRRTQLVQSIVQSKPPDLLVQLHKAANVMAGDMSEYADGIGAELPSYTNAWARVERSQTALLPMMQVSQEADRVALVSLGGQFQSLREATRSTLESLRTQRRQIEELRKMRIARDLSVAVLRFERTLDSLIDALMTGDACVSRLSNLVDQRLTAIEAHDLPSPGPSPGNS